MKQIKTQHGFSITELLLIMGVFALLFGFASLNLLGIRSKTSLGTSVDVLLSDMKGQQIKAMTGTEGGDNYGVHFQTNSYVLFKSSFNPSNPDNFEVTLDDITVDTTLPGSEVVFSKISGEVTGFNPSGNTIRFSSSSSTDQKIITLNRFGVVRGVN